MGALRLYLSHSQKTLDDACVLAKGLRGLGHEPWLFEEQVKPGADWQGEARAAMMAADACLVIFSAEEQTPGFQGTEIEWARVRARECAGRFLIPIHVGRDGAVRDPFHSPIGRLIGEWLGISLPALRDLRKDCVSDDAPAEQLLEALQPLQRALEELVADCGERLRPASPNRVRDSETPQVTGLHLTNIRCFRELEISLQATGSVRTVLLLGDNAAGKSTVLRSLAIGLAPLGDASTMAGLLPNSLLRAGETVGEIVVDLRRTPSGVVDRVRTVLTRSPAGDVQLTRPSGSENRESAPAGESLGVGTTPTAFLCGYGTHRLDNVPFSPEAYSALAATNGLFTTNSRLLNPELVLLRQPPEERTRLLRKLAELLELPPHGDPITLGPLGMHVSGPWGSVPLSSLGDGYRSTIRWLSDFLGWQILAGRYSSGEGCLLIDEIEQHLHPRWQRVIMSRLRTHLPAVQMFATTHSPLVAAGAAELADTALFHLALVDGAGRIEQVDPADLGGRADQTLTSPAFGLVTTKTPGQVDRIERYTELAERPRSAEEEREFQGLREALSDWGQPREESPWRQEIEQAIRRELDRRAQLAAHLPIDAEIRRQLDALLEIGS